MNTTAPPLELRALEKLREEELEEARARSHRGRRAAIPRQHPALDRASFFEFFLLSVFEGT